MIAEFFFYDVIAARILVVLDDAVVGIGAQIESAVLKIRILVLLKLVRVFLFGFAFPFIFGFGNNALGKIVGIVSPAEVRAEIVRLDDGIPIAHRPFEKKGKVESRNHNHRAQYDDYDGKQSHQYHRFLLAH